MLSISAKQKINTKSSTEAELVSVDDAMTFVMWMKHFFESQVRSIDANSLLKPLGSNITIKKDNRSAIQLERNGLKSSSKRTKHSISLIDSKMETSVELSISQLEISKVIILLSHSKEIHSTLIVKLSCG